MECLWGAGQGGGFKVTGGRASVPFHSFVIALDKQYKLQTS